jgi:hypothetical protein
MRRLENKQLCASASPQVMAEHGVAAPESYWKFRCIGEVCEDNCCHSWDVAVLHKELRRIAAVTRLPLHAITQPRISGKRTGPAVSARKLPVLRRRPGGECVFQTDSGLCRVHRDYSETLLPKGCQRFPRQTGLIHGMEAAWLSFGCPEAVRVALSGAMTICREQGEVLKLPVETLDAVASTEPVTLLETLLAEIVRLSGTGELQKSEVSELISVGDAYLRGLCARLQETCEDDVLVERLSYAATARHSASARPASDLAMLQQLLWHMLWMFSRGAPSDIEVLGRALFFTTLAVRLADVSVSTEHSWGLSLVSATYRSFRQLYHKEATYQHVRWAVKGVAEEPKALFALTLTLDPGSFDAGI